MSNSNRTHWRNLLRSYRLPAALALIAVCGLGSWYGSDLLVWRGQQLVDQRQHDKARWWLDLATNLGTTNAAAYFHRSRVERRLGHSKESLDDLDQAEQLGWDAASVERERLLQRLTKKQFPESVDAWRSLVTNAGSDLPEICEAFVYFRLARFETIDAVQILDAWQAEYPEDARAFQLRGTVMLTQEMWQDAAVQFEQAVRLAPDQDGMLLDVAKVRMQQLFYPKAIAALKRCVELNSGNYDARVLLARALSKTGKVEDARSMLVDLLDHRQTQPETVNVEILSELGELELDDGQVDRAVELLAEAATLAPYDREVRYLYARALRKAGDVERSKAEFNFVREATKAVSKLSALTAEMVGDPSNIELRFEVANLHWKYESRETGMRWFQQLLAIAPDHIPTHRILAEHYRLQDDQVRSRIHQRLVEQDESRQR